MEGEPDRGGEQRKTDLDLTRACSKEPEHGKS